MNTHFVPIKKVLNIINSCESSSQLKNCLKIIDNYTELVKISGVVNSNLVKKRLLKEYKQKKFQIKFGRPAGVQMIINDQPVGKPGNGQAREIVITRKGIWKIK